MSVEFNDEGGGQARYSGPRFQQAGSGEQGPRGITGKLISSGIVKTQEGANKLLITIAVLVFIAAGVIFYYFNQQGKNTYVQIESQLV